MALLQIPLQEPPKICYSSTSWEVSLPSTSLSRVVRLETDKVLLPLHRLHYGCPQCVASDLCLFFFSLITEIALRSSEAGKTKPLHGNGIIKSICSLLGCILQWKCPKNRPMFIYYQHRYTRFVLLGYANWNIIEKYKFPMRRDWQSR